MKSSYYIIEDNEVRAKICTREFGPDSQMLQGLHVHHLFRRRGYGRRLMGTVCADADRERMTLYLLADADRGAMSQYALVRWYKRLGFVQTRRSQNLRGMLAGRMVEMRRDPTPLARQTNSLERAGAVG
jgi:ribosomal protein S18 acetylase RimI-like enzyme